MAITPPRGRAPLSKDGPQPFGGSTKVLTASEKARLEDQTVPYVGAILSSLVASEKAYPQVNPGALNLVRALLDITVSERGDTLPLAQADLGAEPKTLALAGARARTSVRGSSSPPEDLAVDAARHDDAVVGRVIGERYAIMNVLASGGMGRVYRAQQASLGRPVAVKIFQPCYSADPTAAKRFSREAAIASKLRHPNTVKIFDYGVTEDNVYYIAMELLAGQTLRQVQRSEGTFTAARTIHIARQVCRSLAEAHAMGVIHRGIKPSNIHLGRHGDETDFVKVIDFGLVKELEEESEVLTKTGLFMGSPPYASPEQTRGKAIDARTDIYSLGMVMHEMLTGSVPFQQKGSFDVLIAHWHESVPKVSERITNHAGAELQAIVRKCLAKDPQHRYASMNELHNALAAVARSRPPQAARRDIPASLAKTGATLEAARIQQGGGPVRTLARRAPLWILLILLAALLLAALLVRLSRVHGSPSAAQRRAEIVPAPEASPPSTTHLGEGVVPACRSTSAHEPAFLCNAAEAPEPGQWIVR